MARNKDNQYLLGLLYSTNAEHNDGSQSNKSCTPHTGSKVKWLSPRLQLIPHQAENNPHLHKLPYWKWEQRQLPAWKGFHQGQHDWGTFGGTITWKAAPLLHSGIDGRIQSWCSTWFRFSSHNNHAYKEYKTKCGTSRVRALNIAGICAVTILNVADRALLVVIRRMNSFLRMMVRSLWALPWFKCLK